MLKKIYSPKRNWSGNLIIYAQTVFCMQLNNVTFFAQEISFSLEFFIVRTVLEITMVKILERLLDFSTCLTEKMPEYIKEEL